MSARSACLREANEESAHAEYSCSIDMISCVENRAFAGLLWMAIGDIL